MSHKYSCDFYGTHMGCVYCHACFPVATMVRHPSSAHTEGSDSRTPARSLMPLVTHSTLIVTTRQPGTRVPLTVTRSSLITHCDHQATRHPRATHGHSSSANHQQHSSLITHHSSRRGPPPISGRPRPSAAGPRPSAADPRPSAAGPRPSAEGHDHRLEAR